MGSAVVVIVLNMLVNLFVSEKDPRFLAHAIFECRGVFILEINDRHGLFSNAISDARFRR